MRIKLQIKRLAAIQNKCDATHLLGGLLPALKQSRFLFVILQLQMRLRIDKQNAKIKMAMLHLILKFPLFPFQRFQALLLLEF